MPHRRALIAVLAVVGALLVVPSAALAGFAQMTGTTTADYSDNTSGEPNNVTVDIVGGRVRFHDPGAAGMGAALPCTVDASDTASCPGEGTRLVTMSLGNADDRVVVLAPIAVSIGGGSGLDTMTGGPLADQLRGGDGPDTVNGGAGDDNIIGDNPVGDSSAGVGSDTIDGGAGNDVVNGGGAADNVRGGDGNDQVSGGDGNDNESGGPGNDNMEATQGDRSGNDVLDGGEGDDTMQGGTGANGADRLIGGPGVDKAVFSDRTNPLVVTLDNQANDGEAGEADDVETDVENVDGGSAGDTLVGDGAANTLAGGGGNDVIAGGSGDDRLEGDGGDDDLQADAAPNGRDVLEGGDGVDTADFSARTHAVDLSLNGIANDGEPGEGDNIAEDVENATGGTGNDDLRGNEGSNALAGGPGENYLDGDKGADSFAGGTSGDVFRSRDGVADTLVCSGADFVVADANDSATGCGRVDLDNTAHKAVLAQSAVVRPVKGSLPDMSPVGITRLVPLRDTINLPFGSILDARGDDIKITSSGGSGRAKSSATVLGKTASATISDGLFQIKQVKAKLAKTDLILKGGDFDSCRASSSRHRASAAASKRTVRKLFGTGKGRFRTRGRFSAATVRGTSWGVRDRCDGTLTTVRRGKVSVFDFVRKKTVFVTTGHTYLARATRAGLRTKR